MWPIYHGPLSLNPLKSHHFNYLHILGQRHALDLTTVTHYNGVIMSAMASQITRLTIVYSTVYSGADQRKHQSSGSLAFVRGINRWQVNSPHKGPVTWKMFPCDDVIMLQNFVFDKSLIFLNMRNIIVWMALHLCNTPPQYVNGSRFVVFYYG